LLRAKPDDCGVVVSVSGFARRRQGNISPTAPAALSPTYVL